MKTGSIKTPMVNAIPAKGVPGVAPNLWAGKLGAPQPASLKTDGKSLAVKK